jgi:hypothetical protein
MMGEPVPQPETPETPLERIEGWFSHGAKAGQDPAVVLGQLQPMLSSHIGGVFVHVGRIITDPAYASLRSEALDIAEQVLRIAGIAL